MPTRQELVLQFMVSLAGNSSYQFSQSSIDNIFAMACALADKYLENS